MANKAYIDCEFNGQYGALRSLAIVYEDSEFYEVIPWPDDVKLDPWVKENVEPILNKQEINIDTFKHKLYDFLERNQIDTIVADHINDIYYLMEVMVTGDTGEMMLDGLWEMNFVVKPELTTKGFDRDGKRDDNAIATRSKILHNALSDARAIQHHDKFLDIINI